MIDDLPIQTLAPLADDASKIAWPDGDLVPKIKLPKGVTATGILAASDWSFNRATPEQNTLSLIIVHKGKIIHERYAEGVDKHTKTRTWSTAKSIAVTLMGILSDQGKMHLDQSLDFEWLPKIKSPGVHDPRNEVTLRHVLNMSSGLYNVCLLYTSPSPRDATLSRMPSSA